MRCATCYFVWRGLATEIMKLAGFSFVFSVCLLLPARADLTIVHKVQGAGQDGEMILKIKGDKARIDASPKMTTIIDGKTGEITNLMNDRKKVLRISAEKMKAATEMIDKFNAKKETVEKPKLTPTGKKEMINGYETEQYVYETPSFKATYWIASKYPDGAAILKQLQSLNSEVWNPKRIGVPDYRDFPGSPLLLASNSPRRHQLLTEAGFAFATIAPDVPERSDVDLTLRELTILNAVRKAISIARAHPGEIVLAADTLVALNDQIIGKPRDVDEAAAILRRLSGRAHEVCSAGFVCYLTSARHGESVRWRTRSTSFYEISRVWFR